MLEEAVLEVESSVEVTLDSVDDEFDEGNMTMASVLMEVTVTTADFADVELLGAEVA